MTDGIADIVWTLPGYTAGRFPKMEVFELPFMIGDAEAASKAAWEFYEKHARDEFREVKVRGETRIPSGNYFLTLEESPKFSRQRDKAGNLVYGHDMLTIIGVPNYLGLRVHMGVDETHTDGCLLVGDQAIPGFNGHKSRLVNSRPAYWRVYPQFAAAIRAESKIPFTVHDESFFLRDLRIPVLGPVS